MLKKLAQRATTMMSVNNHISNMPMKTNTPPNSETQARIQQLKPGVDWHADHFRVVRMCDGQSRYFGSHGTSGGSSA
jgi:hypothetical protein